MKTLAHKYNNKKDNIYVPYLNNIDRWKKHIHYQEDWHHIVPRSRGGSNVRENKVKLYKVLHEALHRVFGNLDPREQLIRLLELNHTALTDELSRDIMKVLSEDDDEYWYKKDVKR